MNAYLNGKQLRLDPSMSIGKGGEADIFNIGNGLVLKLFKTPSHADYVNDLREQTGARERLTIHQEKLRNFPKKIPSHAVSPIDLAFDRSGDTIVGYTMKFLSGMEPILRYGDKKFRQAVDSNFVTTIFLDLHSTLAALHHEGIVCGDFNDLNVLVPATHDAAHVIDVDSWQFGKYLCRTFTERFVDPLLCDSAKTSLELRRPHNVNSDWYAYAIMLMQSLLYVGPYGGIYKPKDASKRIPHGARPLRRITVFNPEVQYPKPALPFDLLSDDLLHRFVAIFQKDERGMFERGLIDGIRWTTCTGCGVAHARQTCPRCKAAAPAAVKQTVSWRGKVRVTTVAKARFLFVTSQEGNLKWVARDGDDLVRETGTRYAAPTLPANTAFRVSGPRTFLASGSTLIVGNAGKSLTDGEKLGVDCVGNVPAFDANADHYYWAVDGKLYRDAEVGPYYIGDVLRNQTRFWVGPKFGFGFYRAAGLHVAFVFDAKSRGINDTVKMPVIPGQLIDATCVFTDRLAWTFTSARSGGKTVNRCVAVGIDGKVVAGASAEDDDGSWLSTIRGKAPTGEKLLCPTDDGIVRVDIVGAGLNVAAVFPDTEPFVDSESRLLITSQGLVAATPRELANIQMQ